MFYLLQIKKELTLLNVHKNPPPPNYSLNSDFPQAYGTPAGQQGTFWGGGSVLDREWRLAAWIRALAKPHQSDTWHLCVSAQAPLTQAFLQLALQ